MGVDGVDHDGQGSSNESRNGQQGFATRKAAPVDGASRLETVSPTGSEVAGIRALPVSTGLISLCVVAGHHQRATDPVQLSRTLGLDPTAEVSETQLLLAAKELGLKAKAVHSNWLRLPNNTMPAIAELRDGGYVVLLRYEPDGHLLVGDPRLPRPQRPEDPSTRPCSGAESRP